MKIKLLFTLLFFIFFSFSALSQGEAAIWYFGANAGVDFNSGTPVALSDGQLVTNEGCSTISNSDGQLLFYTDGSTVWDKNHNVMPNGTGLLGDSTSTQSGIIVPKPENPDIYFIFTVDFEANPFGLQYSEVDLTLNGGNGDITSNKNIELLSPSTEKISAVAHSNGTDFWVVSHAWNSADFYVYKVDFTGVVSTPVVSTVGTVHSGNAAQTIGYLKLSPDGTKLALAKYTSPSIVEVFDFDASTGIVSNPKLIDGVFYQGEEQGAYGVEFSPDSNLLYISDTNFSTWTSRVHQFNLSFNTSADIINSDTILYSGNDMIAAIQLAIDENIYLANANTNFLDVIDEPNNVGAQAAYINRGFNLGSQSCIYGLPPFIQSFFIFGIQTENNCFGEITQFSVNANQDLISVSWDFGDGETSDEISPTHTYNASGTYQVSVTVSTLTETETLTKEVVISDVPVAFPVSNYVLCDDSSNDGEEVFDLTTKDAEALGSQSPTSYAVAYFETFEEAELNQSPLSDNYTNISTIQTIYARVYNIDNYRCYDITSFDLIVDKQPTANTVATLILCDDEVNDETELVDLTMFDVEVLNGQDESEFSISYHLTQSDADLGVSGLPDDFQTQTNPQPIFVRIENNLNTTCYDTTTFNIEIDGQLIAYRPQNMYACDDDSNDGMEFFNLTSQNDQISNGQTRPHSVSYHASLEDAELNSNPLPANYENTNNPQEIFVRIENPTNPNCFDTTSFHIEVMGKPVIHMDDLWYLCTDEAVLLYADDGFDAYSWSTGETSQYIVVYEPGTYTVTVTRDYITSPAISCTQIKDIRVVESDEAVLQDIVIEDWSVRDNNLTIFVDGIGDYEYSLDDVVYQDSNFFSNLPVGEYTVYVRDKNGCGVITEVVYILFHPRYFTPNGDGYNDTWQVYFSSTEPDITTYVFDRHGKLLIELSPTSSGWDGSYNGNPMPSSDYWFVVKRPSNGKEYKGHFTLKR